MKRPNKREDAAELVARLKGHLKAVESRLDRLAEKASYGEQVPIIARANLIKEEDCFELTDDSGRFVGRLPMAVWRKTERAMKAATKAGEAL